MVIPAAESSDEALAARAASGDTSAFEALVARYQQRVFRLACRLTSETDAPDVLQETFLQAYRSLPAFRGESQFGTWLYRIATNAGLMHRRARMRRPAESLEQYLPAFDAEGRHASTPEALRVVTHLDQWLDRQELARQAQAAIEALPERYRGAFVLRDLEDLPTADVAVVLGVTPAAVRQRVHRARLMVRGYLSRRRGVAG